MLKCNKCGSDTYFIKMVGLLENNIKCYCEKCKNESLILEKDLYSLFKCESCGKRKWKILQNNDNLIIKCQKCGHEQIVASKKPHNNAIDLSHDFKWDIDYQGQYNPTVCQRCNSDNLSFLDNNAYYEVRCNDCNSYTWIMKSEYEKQFECPDCGSLKGELQENDSKLCVRCTNCGKVVQRLTKSPNMTNLRSSEYQLKKQQESVDDMLNGIPKCPKCGSKSVSTGQRGYSIMTGFLGSSRTINRCGKCGYKWYPGK